jgi:hypothetical protein
MKEADTNNAAMASLGRIAVAFARLEHELWRLLDLLVCGRRTVELGVITQELPLKRKLDYIKTISEHRFLARKALLQRFKALVKAVDEQRTLRNGFIHGDWRLWPTADSTPCVVCRNLKFRVRRTKTSYSVADVSSTILDLSELDGYCRTVNDLVEKTRALQADIEQDYAVNTSDSIRQPADGASKPSK